MTTSPSNLSHDAPTSPKVPARAVPPDSRTTGNTSPGLLPKEVAESIVTALDGLDFGSVEITVHNGRVVQIERHQRIRFTNEGPGGKTSHSPPRKTP